MTPIRAFAFAAAAALLAACQTTPAYAPAASPNAAGYSEQQIESNRFFVTYRAPGGARESVLQDYALMRAADLTLQHNHEWFWVDRRTRDDNGGRRSGPSVGVGIGGATFGGHSALGTSVGLSFPLGGGGASASAVTLEIRFGEGVKPDDANAYDARATSANLHARLQH